MARLTPTHEQLALLGNADVPVQVRLDNRTRCVGLAGVARARAALEEAQRLRAQREESELERNERHDGERTRGHTVVEVPLDAGLALGRRAMNDELVDRLVGNGGQGAL